MFIALKKNKGGNNKMKQFLAMILESIGISFADISNSACPALFIDEPEMPKFMIEK